MKYICCLSFILCPFKLSAATLDVEIQGITDKGTLHLVIYSSKEVFESDRGDKPSSQTGIEAGVVEKIGKGAYRDSFEISPGTYAMGYTLTKMRSLILIFLDIPKEQYGFSNNA